MLNFLINFCLITFLCYAVAGPVKAILFPKKAPHPPRCCRNSSRGIEDAFARLRNTSAQKYRLSKAEQKSIISIKKSGTQKPACRLRLYNILFRFPAQSRADSR